MHFFVSVLIFLFILCFYIHLQYQYKTSNDLEIYELDYTTNKQLQEICHLKQPVLFQIDHFKEVESFFKTISLSLVSGIKEEDVNVKDLRDYYKPNITSVDAISLSFSSAYGLMETDTKGYFFSENNSDFVRERIHDFSKIDGYLASPWIIHKHYDLLFGSKNAHTPLRYHTETGRFLVVSNSESSYNEEKYISFSKMIKVDEFYKMNDYRTTIRGLKVRGVYDTHKEANVRAQVLRRKDPTFNVFVGQIGYWLPWDPECEQIPEQEYQESMLNDLVKKYKENLESKDDMYEKYKNENKEKKDEEEDEEYDDNNCKTNYKDEKANLYKMDGQVHWIEMNYSWE
jgi:hypothetical protein